MSEAKKIQIGEPGTEQVEVRVTVAEHILPIMKVHDPFVTTHVVLRRWDVLRLLFDPNIEFHVSGTPAFTDVVMSIDLSGVFALERAKLEHAAERRRVNALSPNDIGAYAQAQPSKGWFHGLFSKRKKNERAE